MLLNQLGKIYREKNKEANILATMQDDVELAYNSFLKTDSAGYYCVSSN